MRIEEKKELKRFEAKTIPQMPVAIRKVYDSLTYREKIFIPYWFQTNSNTEAALLAGIDARNAAVRGCQIFRTVEPVVRYLEDCIFEHLTKKYIKTNVITKEAILEKMVMMFTPDLGDFEDYDTAKKNGFLAAAKEVEFLPVYDANGMITGHKKVVTKLIDQKAVGIAICDILGFKAPIQKEVSGPGGTPLQAPVIHVHMNSIRAPQFDEADKAIPVRIKTINQAITG
jgi:hypothetical protein